MAAWYVKNDENSTQLEQTAPSCSFVEFELSNFVQTNFDSLWTFRYRCERKSDSPQATGTF